MKHHKLLISWSLGVLLLLIGILSIFQSFLGGICLIIASSFLLPPATKFISLKTNIVVPFKMRAISIIVLVFTYGTIIGPAHEISSKRLLEKKSAARKQRNLEYFNVHREEIISTLRQKISEKDYTTAISDNNRYLVSNDTDLVHLVAVAKSELAKFDNVIQTKKLIAELNSVSKIEFDKIKSIYEQLVTLHPENTQYISKVEFYSEKIEEQKKKQSSTDARNELIESQFSARDGSHRTLTKSIKESMNDPQSYQHVKTVYWDKGNYILVRTTFRGKNAFGALKISTVNAKISFDGKVIQILE